MVRRGSFIGGQDNLSVPDAPTIGATSGALNGEVTVAFTAPSDVGDDPITNFGVSVFPATGTTKTFRVTVASGNLYGGGTGNVFYIDSVGNPELTLVKGFTYVFDQSDSSNSNHPFHFKDTGGSQYSTGVTVTGTAGQSGSKVTLVLAEDATEPSQYYCTVHGNGMGNLITLVAPSASDDPLGQAQYSNTGSSSPITVTGLSNGTSYVAKVWAINDYGNGPLSDATSSFTPVAGTVGLFMAGYSGSSAVNIVDKIVPEIAGDAVDFGDTSAAKYLVGGFSSDTRAIVSGGYGATTYNVLEYFTFSSAGNATDFGDLSAAAYGGAGLSNNVRGIVTLGYSGGYVNTLEYVTIASTGNSIDFGDASVSERGFVGTGGSATRGIFGGGENSGKSNVIDYVTIASTANATDFGDLTVARYTTGASNNTRCIFFGGNPAASGYSNVIDYITIANTGNATDFGDAGRIADFVEGLANSTKGIFAGGRNDSGNFNDIQQVTIATTGNATDFGDLTGTKEGTAGACSGTEAVQNEDYFAPSAMGMFAGGVQPAGGLGSYGTTIEYIDIASTGNTAMFGDLSEARSYVGATASSTRSVFAGGYTGSGQNRIDFVLFSTKGIATNFGNLLSAIYSPSGSGSNTRGIFAGSTPRSNVIQYITIASAGNATDFGDMTVSVQDRMSASSTTRSVMAAGFEASDDVNVIDYITIASTGNATDFGDLSVGTYQTNGAVSSNTRAVFGLGRPYDGSSGTSSTVNTLEYVTIASTGNSTDFGDLTVARYFGSAASSKVRGVFAGGSTYPSGGSPYLTTTMDYITIASTGNATDFGDIISESYAYGGSSNSHGGIS